jgi:hypothetical protein
MHHLGLGNGEDGPWDLEYVALGERENSTSTPWETSSLAVAFRPPNVIKFDDDRRWPEPSLNTRY